ncbi:Mut7-C RNAse domain-containing protein [Candidatus Micrarchaeota archaeon]|nr:Mut7-C RNAse domain-containing protein [Candidatus Micrarchaeota archaeon]
MKKEFIADAMLGDVARWLRMMGFDTLYVTFEDEKIIALAEKEKRIILTRDRELCERALKKGIKCVLCPFAELDSMLLHIAKETGLEIPEEPTGTLCTDCNGPLKKNEKGWVCKRCGKEYWEGSHWKRIRQRFKQLKEDLNSFPKK